MRRLGIWIATATLTLAGCHWIAGYEGANDRQPADAQVDAPVDAPRDGEFFDGQRMESSPKLDAMVDDALTLIAPTQWAIGLGSDAAEAAASVAVDAYGNCYIMGTFGGEMRFASDTLSPVGGSFDIFIATVDAQGKERWARSFGGTETETGHAVAVLPNNSLLAAGSYQQKMVIETQELQGGPEWGIALTRHDRAGGLVWARSSFSSQSVFVTGLAATNDNGAVVVGDVDTDLRFGTSSSCVLGTGDRADDGFLARFDAAGDCMWIGRHGGSGGLWPRDVTVATSGDILITGLYQGEADLSTDGNDVLPDTVRPHAFLASFDEIGTHNWSIGVGGDSGQHAGLAIAADGVGNVYISGSMTGEADFGGGTLPCTTAGEADQIVVASYDASGEHRWSRCFVDSAATGDEDSRGRAIAVHGDDVFVAGHFEGAPLLDESQLQSAGGKDAFVAWLDATDGRVLSALGFGSTEDDSALDIAVRADGQAIVITGDFDGDFTFATGEELIHQGKGDIFVVSLLPSSLAE